MTAIIFLVSLYTLLFIALSTDFVQNKIRTVVEKELSDYIGSRVEIGQVQISPFNVVVVKDMTVWDKDGVVALKIHRAGAGISLWRLVRDRRLDFSHAELVGLKGNIYQKYKGAPLNIQYIIDAFKPKDKNKPPTKFDFSIRHIILRNSAVNYNLSWKPKKQDGTIDFNHLALYDINADMSMPLMRNDDFYIDLPRLSFKESSGLYVSTLKCNVHLTPKQLDIKGLALKMAGTDISFPEITLYSSNRKKYDFIGGIWDRSYKLTVENAVVTPSDFSFLLPLLKNFSRAYDLGLSATLDYDFINVDKFKLNSQNSSLSVDLAGRVDNYRIPDSFNAVLSELKLIFIGDEADAVVGILADMKPEVASIIKRCGDIKVDAPLLLSKTSLNTKAEISTSLGSCLVDADVLFPADNLSIKGSVKTDDLNLGALLGNKDLGSLAIEAEGDVTVRGKDITGSVAAVVPYFDYRGKRWTNINAELSKAGKEVDCSLDVNDDAAMLTAQVQTTIGKTIESLYIDADIDNIDLSQFNLGKSLSSYSGSCSVNASLTGTSVDNLLGSLDIGRLIINHKGNKLDIGDVSVVIDGEPENRELRLDSRFLTANAKSTGKVSRLGGVVKNLLRKALPSLIDGNANGLPRQLYAGAPETLEPLNSSIDFDIRIFKESEITDYFKLPVKLLSDVSIEGYIDEADKDALLSVKVPYLQQGKDKLIRDTYLHLLLDGKNDLYTLDASTIMPSKSNEMALDFKVKMLNDSATTDLSWLVDRKGNFRGNVSLTSHFMPGHIRTAPWVKCNVNKTNFIINDTVWNINPAEITYHDNTVDVNDVRIWSGNQYLTIDGRASAASTDTIKMRLKNMDLDYVFGTLGINYVNFGGMATGDFIGYSLMSKTPVAYTPELFVKGLTYNGGLLGDANIRSWWDGTDKKVALQAKINEKGKRVADINGGIWLGKDSLSFGLDASKVNIKFLQPFMAAFTSNVSGRASGETLLYGTFKDINLRGRVFADTISMLVDYTNTVYSGSDSVIIDPGYINVSNFTLHDTEGHTATLNGWVRHRYFHEPSFEFKISNARNFLCYNTNSLINPDWYGTIYGNGGGTISGHPGVVDILVDMQTAPKSTFTFVLSDREDAADYTFLTFSDRRKDEELAKEEDTTPDIIKQYRKKIMQEQQGSSLFNMDLRATVTPQAEVIIVMDPVAGDKIKAFGSGTLQMGYTNIDDKLSMYGKYTLERGTYNFSLQDLILKTFTIRPGSYISFNGDPFSALLDIDAIYKVNANLSDLDKSFSTDKDLNRTNVPVDAILSVNGEMQNPEITFDIELPTLTQDVARKVKSIVSTEDMMSRQIIYLLALNRFYTPDYMGAGGSNNELASIASTTLSSHLTNILGQLSDNWNIAPNLRSENGDFSDLEFDLALSSSLLNNRLLLNGNFGYRDRATSSTTFIGDFDIEYLLNKRGTFRLKAYNHYNDQNYYLKSALTTQGIGVVFKHDFNTWFNFLRKKRKKNKSTEKPLPVKESAKTEEDRDK